MDPWTDSYLWMWLEWQQIKCNSMIWIIYFNANHHDLYIVTPSMFSTSSGTLTVFFIHIFFSELQLLRDLGSYLNDGHPYKSNSSRWEHFPKWGGSSFRAWLYVIVSFSNCEHPPMPSGTSLNTGHFIIVRSFSPFTCSNASGKDSSF